MIGAAFSTRTSTRWARSGLYPYWLTSGWSGGAHRGCSAWRALAAAIAGERLGAGGVERQVGGKREGRQPRRLDRVEVSRRTRPCPWSPSASGRSRPVRRRAPGPGRSSIAAPSPSSASRAPRRCPARRSRAGRRARARHDSLRHSAIVQGTGLRTATTSRRRFEEAQERAPRPVLKVARRVPEIAHVLQPPQVQGAPQRLSGHADDRPGPRQPGDDLERGLRDRPRAPSPRSRGSARRSPRRGRAPRSAPP